MAAIGMVRLVSNVKISDGSCHRKVSAILPHCCRLSNVSCGIGRLNGNRWRQSNSSRVCRIY